MATITHDDLHACIDCVLLIANADGTEERAERIAARFPGVHLVVDDKPEFFSHRACDTCGDPLAGDRHEVVGLSA